MSRIDTQYRRTLFLGLALGTALVAGSAATGAATELDASARFGDLFWAHWGDGRAELATYDLVFDRYGHPRRGTAVAIFVTETFDPATRVKTDEAQRADAFPVMKLNLVEDFATGVYDYNLMTSTFVALVERDGRPRGHTTKVTHSMQEWCGHTWVQLVFDGGTVRYELHSYFDGEADRQSTLDAPPDALTEDTLMLWARELAGPFLAPGASTTRPLLDAAKRQRIQHTPPQWSTAVLHRAASTTTVAVPAGHFEVQQRSVQVGDEVIWRFDVEHAAPHRLIRWENAMGQSAELVAVERMPYWKMNGPAGQESLEALGLRPRPSRTP